MRLFVATVRKTGNELNIPGGNDRERFHVPTFDVHVVPKGCLTELLALGNLEDKTETFTKIDSPTAPFKWQSFPNPNGPSVHILTSSIRQSQTSGVTQADETTGSGLFFPPQVNLQSRIANVFENFSVEIIEGDPLFIDSWMWDDIRRDIDENEWVESLKNGGDVDKMMDILFAPSFKRFCKEYEEEEFEGMDLDDVKKKFNVAFAESVHEHFVKILFAYTEYERTGGNKWEDCRHFKIFPANDFFLQSEFYQGGKLLSISRYAKAEEVYPILPKEDADAAV